MFQPVKWTFPNIDKCPIKECSENCTNRETAVKHFRDNHAALTTVCTVCDELFLLSRPLIHILNILIHYQEKHPNVKPPKLKSVILLLFLLLFISQRCAIKKIYFSLFKTEENTENCGVDLMPWTESKHLKKIREILIEKVS